MCMDLGDTEPMEDAGLSMCNVGEADAGAKLDVEEERAAGEVAVEEVAVAVEDVEEDVEEDAGAAAAANEIHLINTSIKHTVYSIHTLHHN